MLLVKPVTFFRSLKENPTDIRPFLVAYGMPLIILAAAGRMTRIMLLYGAGEETLRGDQLAGIFLIGLVAYALSVWLGAYGIARIAPAFRSDAGHDKTMLMVMLAYTPYLLAQPLSLIYPYMPFFQVAAMIYTVYLFSKGARELLNVATGKLLGFTLISYFLIFGISHLATLMLTELFIFAG
ncbi:MAG: Yip1 family protein [Bacteroidales bacterium]|nr:Yip1 family protein [Bacteroidales bacterium]